jgi:protein-S-isoprenylcysteine O-methyltransferase Ste14
MPGYAYVIVAAGWLIWTAPFVLARRREQRAQQVDRRARWGILLVALSYAILWQGPFWTRPVPSWRLALSILFLAVAPVFSWTATATLGKQWRLDAGLNADHELVTAGPYRIVRHPIYTSLLALLAGTGFMITPLPLLLLSLAVYLLGTEIRVRSEERLLASRFGEQFREYQRTVPAYIPFLK